VELKAYLNPNPVLRGDTLTDPYGREYAMRNDPFLEVELCDFPAGGYEVRLLAPFVLQRDVAVSSPRSSLYFLDPRFEDLSISEVTVGVTGAGVQEERTLPIRVYRLTGQVQDFDGQPLVAYVWATRGRLVEHEIVVRTDESGNFTLWHPEGRRLRVFVGDVNYGKTTLECWIMADELKGNVEVHPHIGDFELYEFRAWRLHDMWNMFFLPAIVDAELPPPLKADDIKVWVNGAEAEVKRCTLHEMCFAGDGQDVHYPAYIVSAMLDSSIHDPCPPVVVRAQVDLGGRGRGEAWFIHFR